MYFQVFPHGNIHRYKYIAPLVGIICMVCIHVQYSIIIHTNISKTVVFIAIRSMCRKISNINSEAMLLCLFIYNRLTQSCTWCLGKDRVALRIQVIVYSRILPPGSKTMIHAVSNSIYYMCGYIINQVQYLPHERLSE